jgi:hypothetical protein
MKYFLLLPHLLLLTSHTSFATEQTTDCQVIDEKLHHIRNGDAREWSDFPLQTSNSSYEVTFKSEINASARTLCLTQTDVKQNWDIALNGSKLGRLHRDENPTIGFWTIPKSTVIDGDNVLSISTKAKEPDDVRVGRVHIIDASMNSVLNEAGLEVTVHDADTGDSVPCRVTIISQEALMTVGAGSTDEMAVRPGVIYCNGTATFGLPAGEYEIVASRGPEYSIDSRSISIRSADSQHIDLTIRREVPTTGFVACDTHVHTLTHSGHGDSSVRERMLTLAGEAIELPIATDHNKHISYDEIAAELDVDSHFTPVIGNEVTTKIGHFNVFPVASVDTLIPDYKADNWDDISKSIYTTPDVKIAILNHARDIHSNFRPFDPKHHISVTGQNLDGWKLQANAIEIINSGAQQTDMMTLVHDWMGLLNAGLQITPVGSSDSHDVARYIVGQGRTYIRCDDGNPGRINVTDAVEAFVAGRVVVSCGLNADIRVNEQFGVGDTVPQSSHYRAEIDVKGPSWIEADRVDIFVNGVSVSVRNVRDENRGKPGVKETIEIDLPISKQQDAFVVAVVSGPGVRKLHWPIARPYQPTSPDYTPRCMAITGAIWIDADGDGVRTAAKAYAEQLYIQANNKPADLISKLQDYDRAVALQVAAKLMGIDEEAFIADVLPIARKAPPTVATAFQDYADLWRQSKRAQVGAGTE